jgi:hypothetical protein
VKYGRKWKDKTKINGETGWESEMDYSVSGYERVSSSLKM